MDPQGSLVQYEYDFDFDGVNFDIDAVGAALNAVSYTFTAAGTYTVAVRVTDDGGLTDLDTLAISVAGPGTSPESEDTASGCLPCGAAGLLPGILALLVLLRWHCKFDGKDRHAD